MSRIAGTRHQPQRARVTASSSSSPPNWARFLDLLCVLIVVVAAIVAMSGGFRVRLGDVRIAFTSPYRLLGWAAIFGVLRHVLAPGAPIYRDLSGRVAAAWKTPSVGAAATVVAGTRPAILFVGYLAVFMFGYREGGAPWRMVENEFVNLQARWDAGWYLTVAIDGYSYDPVHPADHQQDIVFFPAFPILMRGAGRLLGSASTAYLLGGTLISLGAFFWALVYLFRFSREMLDDGEQARSSMWLLAAYPFAIFFSAVYSESLYLLGVIGAFYHFRRREFWRAGAWGLLVGLDRAPGCLLSAPLALMAIGPWMPPRLLGGPREGAARNDRDDSVAITGDRPRPAPHGRLSPAIAAAAMPGVGVLLYSAYLWQLTGHPLAWAEGHAAWGRQYNGLGILVTQRYAWLSQGGLYAYTSQGPGDLLNVLGAIFVLATVWPVARRLGLPYAAFILINILPPLAAGGFLSAGRFSSVLFPSFVWLASAVPARHRPAWVASFMAVQAFNAALFYTWRPLY
jgi:hypothetical protein